MSIAADATRVLLTLARFSTRDDDPEMGRHYVEGSALKEATGFSPQVISDAVDLLEENGYVRVRRAIGTSPFSFLHAQPTPRGRYEAERLISLQHSEQHADALADRPMATPVPVPMVSRSPTPAGSPYGFTEQDWATVAVDRSDTARLIVRLGFQWESAKCDPAALAASVEGMFNAALSALTSAPVSSIRLDYRRLEGGYGGHLFNEIARDIIGADIVVIDTSDLNPNVMIELGVALTWGVALLPIRRAGSPKPPTDISGQTWAEYDDSGRKWTDPRHGDKLAKLVELVLRRKGGLS